MAKKVWPARRRAVLARYGNHCRLCPSTTRLKIHHIVGRIDGGGNETANLELLCYDCHLWETSFRAFKRRHAKHFFEFDG